MAPFVHGNTIPAPSPWKSKENIGYVEAIRQCELHWVCTIPSIPTSQLWRPSKKKVGKMLLDGMPASVHYGRRSRTVNSVGVLPPARHILEYPHSSSTTEHWHRASCYLQITAHAKLAPWTDGGQAPHGSDSMCPCD